MKKRLVSLSMSLAMLVSVVPAFEVSAAAANTQNTPDTAAYTTQASDCAIPKAESTAPGQLCLSGIGTDIAYRLVFPDGSKSLWSIRGEYDDDNALIQPLDGGAYYLEACPLSAMTVLVPDSDYPPEKYDLRSDIPADQIQTSEQITVEQPAEEGDNILDLAEGEVLLSPSYNDHAAFQMAHDVLSSEFDYASVTEAPAVKYVSMDNGTSWNTLTGDVTITSSSAEPVANGVRFQLNCGNNVTNITLENLNTTGNINTALFGETVVKIKGNVSVKRFDTEQLGTLTIIGADSSAKLHVTRAILSAGIEIKDLAQLKAEGSTIAINCIMGDLKLTNISDMDISVSSNLYASGIRSYDANVILTDVFGTISLPNDPTGQVVETGTDKLCIINNSGAYIYAGSNRFDLEEVELQGENVFPADKISAQLTITAEPLPAPDAYLTCAKDETCPLNGYTDISADAWYHNGVHFCLDNDIMDGYADGIFAPGTEVTRQQVWMALARLSGVNPADEEQARAWAMSNGVSDGTYPTDFVTRQQFITMLHHYAQLTGYDVSVGEDTNILSYDDAFDIAEYAIPAMQWGCGSGVMSGYGDGSLKPTATTTRAQLACFLCNFFENVMK